LVNNIAHPSQVMTSLAPGRPVFQKSILPEFSKSQTNVRVVDMETSVIVHSHTQSDAHNATHSDAYKDESDLQPKKIDLDDNAQHLQTLSTNLDDTKLLATFSVKQLKGLCKQHHLPQKGNKNELIQTLVTRQ